ncbi:MipA/OmpV family protein [Psychromonas ossibalaenae]|uniref:MipA/OmpV family protein n=1 Tax=Psychromonas ossibalaenae TaxID=444922 RepID=UPI00037311D6|nr:MipA/OmpV family protein [Psychromonas ossibalaenae]
MKSLFLLLFIFSSLSSAQEQTTGGQEFVKKVNSADQLPVHEWGIAVGLRNAHIPFVTDDDVVTDFVPKLFYEGEHLYLRGEYGGLRFYQQDDYNFSVLGRYRYFDFPAQYQNEFQGTKIDFGLQFEYLFAPNFPLQIELMSDNDGRTYLNNHLRYALKAGSWDIDLGTTFRYKSTEFNNTYYGLGLEDIGSDYDLKVGTQLRYHVVSNLYLMGEANLTRLGHNTYHNPLIASPTQADLFLGFGFFNDKSNPQPLTLPDNHYLRWSFGWATPSNIGEIIRFNSEKDEYNNRLTSLFYGFPLSETLFSLPIELYLTGGYAFHLESEVQDPISEYVVAIKAYYTFTWPTRWRFGFAEGLSYVSDLTYIEKTEMENKEYNGSQLLNYLDFSLDVNLGDLFNEPAMDKLWLGYAIHHRSAIFETSSLFGRIKGGSNYNTVYLQWHF